MNSINLWNHQKIKRKEKEYLNSKVVIWYKRIKGNIKKINAKNYKNGWDVNKKWNTNVILVKK